MGSFEISQEDLKVVEKQLKRSINNKTEIGKRCKYGYPQTIKNYPIMNKKPFPTMYWLTCPYLNEQISKIESINMIDKIQEEIYSDEYLSQKIYDSHQKEINERLEIIGEEINELPDPMKKTLIEKGIGGISDFKYVKCLHLHYASYLSGNENPIGEKVDKLLKSQNCENCICCNL